VFLNACQTGVTANETNPQSVGEYFWKPAEGLASAFLYGGALGCVGSLWPVYDEPAAEFAVEFYNQVLEGQMIGEAMRRTRRSIKTKHPDSITWASFVLYGDPTFRLVR
jgi:CHAT domain-containing protein